MHKQGKRAYQHSTYIRPDRKEVMFFARQVAESQGESLSRFLTDLAHDFLIGKLEYKKRKK